MIEVMEGVVFLVVFHIKCLKEVYEHRRLDFQLFQEIQRLEHLPYQVHLIRLYMD